MCILGYHSYYHHYWFQLQQDHNSIWLNLLCLEQLFLLLRFIYQCITQQRFSLLLFRMSEGCFSTTCYIYRPIFWGENAMWNVAIHRYCSPVVPKLFISRTPKLTQPSDKILSQGPTSEKNFLCETPDQHKHTFCHCAAYGWNYNEKELFIFFARNHWLSQNFTLRTTAVGCIYMN